MCFYAQKADWNAHPMVLILKLTAMAAGLYVVAVLSTQYLQRALLYFPDPARILPAVAGLSGVDEIVLEASGGEKVIAWWGRAANGKPTILYFHGNAGSLITRAERFRRYREAGYGVFMMTYRGYGGSTGAPSERGNVADALLAYDKLVASGVPETDIVSYGESLGTGIAVQVGAVRRPGGVILDAPYTSIVDVAELHYPYLPARPFMTDRYESLRHIAAVEAPLLVVHGERDEIIPPSMARTLYEAARSKKQLAIVPGAGHSDHGLYGSYDIIFDWLSRHRQRALPKAAE